MANTQNSTTEEKALALLGDGIDQSVVASHLGVTEGYISQLVSREEFAAKLIEIRYENLSKHNARDKEYDSVEDELLEKLKGSIPMLFRPMEIARTLQMVNQAKRRGSSAPAATTSQQTIVKIVMPVRVINKFTTNIHNQVIEAGDQKLVTIQSGTLMTQLKESQAQREKLLIEQAPDYGHERNAGAPSTASPAGIEQAARAEHLARNAIPA